MIHSASPTREATISILELPTGDRAHEKADVLFRAWLADLSDALVAGDAAGFGACFLIDGYWKDILTFGWGFATHSGRDEIQAAFAAGFPQARPQNVRVPESRSAPNLRKRSAHPVIEAYFDFDTAAGRSSAFVRLQVDESSPEATPKAWIFLTALQELHGGEELVGDRRPSGAEYSGNFSGENWLDKRTHAGRFADREPQVLIVGAGQSGLMLGARLGQMGVDALIVEKNPRVGDNWRQRYHSLTLHNEVWANSLPYLDFPTTWPAFLPKDKLAGWLEGYAESMELNVWTSTELADAQYDEADRVWTIRLRRPDGERTVRVPHMVMATGSVSGIPKRPILSGLDDFSGRVMHSSEFTTGVPFRGQRAIVIGTGNSGHDVAQDLYCNGAAEVTIVQRSATCVVSLVPSGTLVYALYSEGPPVDDVDLITAAIPYPILRDTYQYLTDRTCALDADLLAGLERVGFETDFEPDRTGFHMRYLRSGGGYYINVGCSELIAERKVKLAHARDITRFTADGMQLNDGAFVGADLVVLATGYENQQESIRRLLGAQVAEKVGAIWGFDDEGYMRGMWRRTGQEGFWLMGGALNDGRLYSRFLAVQIRAALDGLLPPLETE